MSHKQRYTPDQVAEAVTKSRGILTGAAQALGCSRQTVDNYVKRHKKVRDAYDNARETTIDFVETKLLKNIDSGDTTAMIFFLKTIGRSRGYVERVETRNFDIDLSKLTNEQLERVAAGDDPMMVVLDGYIAATKSGG